MYDGEVCRVRGVGEVVDKLNCAKIPSFESIVVEGGADSGACYKTYDTLDKIIAIYLYLKTSKRHLK